MGENSPKSNSLSSKKSQNKSRFHKYRPKLDIKSLKNFEKIKRSNISISPKKRLRSLSNHTILSHARQKNTFAFAEIQSHNMPKSNFAKKLGSK
jgi:hypothetical protein